MSEVPQMSEVYQSKPHPGQWLALLNRSKTENESTRDAYCKAFNSIRKCMGHQDNWTRNMRDTIDALEYALVDSEEEWVDHPERRMLIGVVTEDAYQPHMPKNKFVKLSMIKIDYSGDQAQLNHFFSSHPRSGSGRAVYRTSPRGSQHASPLASANYATYSKRYRVAV